MRTLNGRADIRAADGATVVEDAADVRLLCERRRRPDGRAELRMRAHGERDGGEEEGRCVHDRSASNTWHAARMVLWGRGADQGATAAGRSSPSCLGKNVHMNLSVLEERCVEEWRPSECGNDGRAGALTGSDISVENMLCGSLQGAVYSRCLTEAITGPKDARLARVSVQDEKTNALGTGDCRGRSGADARSRDRPFRVSRLDIRFHTSIDVPSFTCRARDRCAPVYLLSAHHILTRAIGTAGRRLRCTARVTVSVVSAPSMQRAA
jgi:hypothetical protein